MTGPEWMIVFAAMQVAAMAATRVLSRTARGEADARFWAVAASTTALTVPVVAAVLGWWEAAGDGIAVVAALVMWWFSRRRDRRRARGLAGAKSRALRDARESGLARSAIGRLESRGTGCTVDTALGTTIDAMIAEADLAPEAPR